MTYDHWKTTEPDPWAHDEPPQQWFTCDACDGSGEIVRGCGWLDDVEHDR